MNLTFLNIGAAKSGTTTLHDILIQHPEICIPEEKDFHFFDNDQNYTKGINWYHGYFTNCNPASIKGEVSATYLYSEEAARRIEQHYGRGLKIILMLRNPVKRAFSEYLHQKRTFSDKTFDLNQYFLDRGRIDSDMPLYESIIDRGFYYKHLKPYIDLFGAEQIRVCFLEELQKDPEKSISNILEFIGADPQADLDVQIKSNPKFSPRNKGFHKLFYSDRSNLLRRGLKYLIPSFKSREAIRKYFKKFNEQNQSNELISPELERYLADQIYRRDIQSLEEFLGQKINCWSL